MTNRLLPGAFAPNFKAVAFGGKVVDTHELRGRKIWLLFYRYSACPLCCLHLSNVVKNESKIFARNMELIVVFESPVGLITQSVCGRSSAHFPMIPDPLKKIYELYGTETKLSAVFRPTVFLTWLKAQFAGFKQGPVEGDLKQIPASFLIDESGVIRTAYYGKTIADHIPWDAVENFSTLPSPALRTVKKEAVSNGTEEVTAVNNTISVFIETFRRDGLVGVPISKRKVDIAPEKAGGIKEKVERTVTDIWKMFGNR